MIEWHIRITQITRVMRQKAFDALETLMEGDEKRAAEIQGYLSSYFQALKSIWPKEMEMPSNLGRHIRFGMDQDYKDMLRSDFSEIETAAEEYVLTKVAKSKQTKPKIQYRYDVFVSYSSLDQEQADILYNAIARAGGKPFLSAKNLKPGDDFAEEIRTQLNASRELWLLVSPNSLQSEWVLTEWGAAWMIRKRIIPIIHRCRPEQLPERLRRIHCIDFYNYSDLIQKTFGPA
jgi:hypothetical protein